MSDYILVNDIHLSDRAPSSCTDTYLDDLFHLLGEVSLLGHRANADAIVLAGDVFHHKTPSRTSHATVMRLIGWARALKTCGTLVYVVPGNHDLSHDRVASIDETQPLGVVIKSGAIKLLDGWIDNGDPVYGVPWQMTFDDTSVYEALADYNNDVDHTLVVTHAPLYPPGQELTYEFYPTQHWADAMENHGTVHYGHVHEPHGIYEVGGVTFSNPGALSRGSLHEHNLTRTPTVAIWHSATGAVEHVALPARPAAEVFRLHEAQAQKAAGLNLGTFLDSIAATQLDITNIDTVLHHIRETQDDPALVAVIAKLLAEVDS